MPSAGPSPSPSDIPSPPPSQMPSSQPSLSTMPSGMPSITPTGEPSTVPSYMPSVRPTKSPSSMPTESPSAVPTYVPSSAPTCEEPSKGSKGKGCTVASPSPSAAPSACEDIPGRFPINGVTQACVWVARQQTTYRCSLEGVSSYCPVTCGVCP